MKILNYKDIMNNQTVNQIKGNTFESNIYVGEMGELYKIFKITETKYNPKDYLNGKREKAVLLNKYFQNDMHLVAPRGLIFDEGYFKGLMYSYINDSYSLDRYMNDTSYSMEEKIKKFKDISQSIRKMHQFKCYHADLGASNILLDSKGNIYIIDLDNSQIGDNKADGRNYFATYLMNSFKYPTEASENLDNLTLMVTFLSLTIGENKVKEYLLDRNVVFENNEVMKIAMIVKKCLKTQISVPYFDDFEIALY